MKPQLLNSWMPYLQDEFEKTYFQALNEFVEKEYYEAECFPPKDQIFNAFNHCAFENVKVVIIGQDPYHDQGQANGLCFSVNDGIKHPPSLVNIFKEIETDLEVAYPESGNLERWADQGVLLLNATLTVRAHQAGSHQKKGWETFTDVVIKTISDYKDNVVFLLWGGYAKKKVKLIDSKKHHVLISGHPSPLSANRGYWFGNKHFSKTNEILRELGKEVITW
ncbi:uracil-DNA glycosylase [Aestuariibaculum lutulentum]|uniref:Uracil-DNA glycosylase n=1 Tax=Aestuariibaculum lutulentum TaxID=2920935 RepID=A0ABS9RI45_9FLAO|nr:uracil-DNA glycosylase [Aestuariibaculum lutulentum]MCH4552613.1 uracil-DNA glycosylase [Aestuariibaculum lutulentum]